MKKHNLLICLSLLALAPGSAIAAGDKAAAEATVVLPTPTAGKGQVVFFRPSSMGFAIKCTVRENGAMVSRVGAGKYHVVEVEPGLHNFTAKTEKTDEVAVQVEPDETSFVKCGISMGVMVGRPNLSPSTAEDFAKATKIKPMDGAKLVEEIEKDRAKLAGAEGKAEGAKD
ncbi:MAG TPA: DUF2846 domain-containing protein [Sphingomicrobium sp.]|nr:DUF2846 domain-containing protein [Sphingomicrobium sp.]